MSDKTPSDIDKGPAPLIGEGDILSEINESSAMNVDKEKLLEIAGKLQTTLDIAELINIFREESAPYIRYNRLYYRNRSRDLEIKLGKTAQYRCTYQLSVAGQKLGELELAYESPITQGENKLFEYLLCFLVYPLRNALMYAKAVDDAQKDPLTGVNNRTGMDSNIKREISRARRYSTPLSLISLDIDHFKKVNDTYGHSTGDEILKSVANTITDTIRETDTLYRYGGEEFVILLSNTDKYGALHLAERIRQRIEKRDHMKGDTLIRTTVSCGVTILLDNETHRELLQKSDDALYQAKDDGRNRIRFIENRAPEREEVLSQSN